jgi:hypothetical protein
MSKNELRPGTGPQWTDTDVAETRLRQSLNALGNTQILPGDGGSRGYPGPAGILQQRFQVRDGLGGGSWAGASPAMKIIDFRSAIQADRYREAVLAK